ncbi:MAG: TetR/AcrR family transcriptional regulator, cholesterol catabolism regulator, partial [Streptosporangiaceae bacterium]|nr:TetR/AcrR family transcriptional regulator, cholesterol catabolism regulator [Streptosporangiaceae bacterium]
MGPATKGDTVTQGDDVQITVTRTLSKEQQARRARLVEAARRLADEGGYAAVTMHDVADRAGVARATV